MAAGTSVFVGKPEYRKGEEYEQSTSSNTQHVSTAPIPSVAKRVYTAGTTSRVTTIAVRYSEKEAQEKLARLRFNRAQLR